MPTDVGTFNMLEQGILDSMTQQELATELARVAIMELVVANYRKAVMTALSQK